MAEPADNQARTSICPVCGKPFICGMVAGEKVCWCVQLPPLPGPPDPAQGCLCPDCLRRKLAEAGQAPA